MSSHDAVVWLRRLARVRVGHAGTLDRAASGVLVLCAGKARRLSRWAVEGDKGYVGEIAFGITTDTLDAEGTVTCDRDASALTAADVERALARFEGDIEQDAPAYSAVHAGGVRLYELARKGEPIPRRTRTVRIFSARLLDFTPGRHPRARIAVECSKGTYIRSLAAQLGEDVGCGGYLSFLVRTRSGTFDIADSITVEEAQRAIAAGRLERLLRPLDEPLGALPAIRLAPQEAHRARHGRAVRIGPEFDGVEELVRVYDPDGAFIGLAQAKGDELRPRLIVCD